jgi:HlyD family secretion protein
MFGQWSQPKIGNSWLLWSGILALTTVAGITVYAIVLNRSPDAIAVSLVTAERGDIESTINESGSVVLRSQVTMKSPIEGAIDQVSVNPGDRITQGQVLLTLRYPERQTALNTQELQTQQQERTLARNRQKILEASERLLVEQRRRDRLTDLVTVGAIDRQRYEEQEERVRSAETSLRDAEAAVDTGEIEIARSRLESQRIQQQLQNSVVVAPVDGVVLDVKVKDGDGVQFRTDLLTIGDPSQELIQLQLSTLDATRVKVNQVARVSVIGPNAKNYPARVQSLYPQAVTPEQNPQTNRGRSSSQPTVPATVKLNTPTRSLIPGAQVNVEIILEQRQDAVSLSSEVVQRSDSKPFVWMRDNQGKAQKRPVTTGLEGLLTIEILSGLNPGDAVILPPATPPLKPGTPVTVELPAGKPKQRKGQK